MDTMTPKPAMSGAPMQRMSQGPFALALIWSAPWLVLLTLYFTLYDWKPSLSLFNGAKPGFITLLGIALFAVTFLATWTLNAKKK